MKNLGKIVLLVLFINSILFGSVVTKVTNQSIVKGDMLSVTIEASGTSVEFPDDISTILGYPVENMGTATQSSYSWINGKQTSTITKSLSFNFYPNATMTIPSFNVKVDGNIEKTNSVDIEVTKNRKQGSNNDAFKIEIEASKSSVMVGESLSVVMKFYRKASLDVKKLDYTPPVFTNFEVNDKESKDRTYRKGNFIVQELSYKIYPKKDGNLTISPAIIKVATPTSNSQDMFRLFAPVKWSKAVSNSIDIEVKPIPNGASLVGEFNILASIDKKKTKANKPIKLQLTISGNGSLDTLREINYNIDGITIFSDDADVKSSFKRNGEMVSSYKKSFVFIGDSNFTIPQQEIVFYNKKEAKLDKLIIPEYNIEVVGGEVQTSSLRTNNMKNVEPKVIIKEVEKHTELSKLILFFMLGVISTLAFLYISPLIRNYKRDNFYSNEKALKILYANMEKSLEIEQIVRDLYAQKAGDKSVKINKKRIKEIIDEIENS